MPDNELTLMEKPLPLGDFYLLAVGIDDYSKHLNFEPLNNCVRDVAAIVETLTTQYLFEKPDSQGYRDLKALIPEKFAGDEHPVVEYQSERTFCLYNENATVSAFEQQLKKLAGKNFLMKENDCLILLFSGHGYVNPDNDKFYIVLHDDKFAAEELYAYFNGFSGASGKRMCRHFLLILDCCYSGKIIFENQGVFHDEDFSRYVLCSTNARQEALDGLNGQKYSPFAKSLLGCLDEYKNWSGGELALAVKKKIRIEAGNKQEAIYERLPTKEIGQGQFPFRVRFNRPKPQKVASRLYGLNFRPQKNRIYDFDPSQPGNKFVVVTLKGESPDTQSFVVKVLFREFRNIFQEKDMPKNIFQKHYFDTGAGLFGVSDFWEGLCNGLRVSEKSDAVEYLLSQLLNNNQILLCHLNPTSPEHFKILQEQINKFLQELNTEIENSDLFKENKEDLNYLFLFFKDSQNNNYKFDDEKIVGSSSGVKIFITEKMDGIKAVDFNQWWNNERENLLETLDMGEFDIVPFRQQQIRPFEDFVKELGNQFKYSEVERSELSTFLFESNKYHND